MKTFLLRSKTVSVNFLQFISCIILVIGNTLLILYKLQVSLFFTNFIFILPKKKKTILKITFILVLATKKIFWKK